MLRIVTFAIVFSTTSVVSAYAQQCLHGPGETPDQAARRREALTATRTINNIQANQPGSANKVYLRHADLVNSPFAVKMRESANQTTKRISLNPDEEILPGWKLTLDVTEQGYWFMIKDTTDPCGFAYVSNQAGLIWPCKQPPTRASGGGGDPSPQQCFETARVQDFRQAQHEPRRTPVGIETIGSATQVRDDLVPR